MSKGFNSKLIQLHIQKYSDYYGAYSPIISTTLHQFIDHTKHTKTNHKIDKCYRRSHKHITDVSTYNEKYVPQNVTSESEGVHLSIVTAHLELATVEPSLGWSKGQLRSRRKKHQIPACHLE